MTRWNTIARRQEKAAARITVAQKRQAVRAYVREATRYAERGDRNHYEWAMAVLRDYWAEYRAAMRMVHS